MSAAQPRRAIALGAREVSYSVRRSARARRLRLRMLPGAGLEVVLPHGATLRDADAFIRREAAWVLRALDSAPAPAPALADGARLPVLGAALTLRVVPGARPAARRVGDELRVAPGGRALPEVIEAWYRAEARHYFAARAAAHADVLGAMVGRIVIKDTRTRWGSCSSKGNLNFSWRLLLAPADVADYVAAHEVAHLRELNHSPRFWAIVAELCPAYQRPKAWLKAHGPELAAWPGG